MVSIHTPVEWRSNMFIPMRNIRQYIVLDVICVGRSWKIIVYTPCITSRHGGVSLKRIHRYERVRNIQNYFFLSTLKLILWCRGKISWHKHKKIPTRDEGEFFTGGLAGARTRDLRLKRALLYQLSYKPVLDFRGRIIYKNIDLSNLFFFFLCFCVA